MLPKEVKGKLELITWKDTTVRTGKLKQRTVSKFTAVINIDDKNKQYIKPIPS